MKKFTKNKEDFVCEHCGAQIKGDGYTNHCAQCLWSKHVDINPGDRAADCGGLMKPAHLEKKGETYIIMHKCQKCGYEKPNKIAKYDNFDTLLDLCKS